MKYETVTIHGLTVPVYSLNTVIVGSGAAGLNAADRLYAFGQDDIAIVTESLTGGTSRNAGSDKQTYYKLTLSGNTPDSVRGMAETLYIGGAMHGDIALVEAAMSTGCFCHLVDIGVPFPFNRYGEYAGYKTDHDPLQRATSAGPLTSRYMTEKLREQIEQKGITVFDGFMIIGILTDSQREKATGLLALNLNELENPSRRYTLFNCTNIVYATGGPAGLFGASVYPECQTGASGIAFEAGVKGKNLTEWQFGIASVKFRWNLSGTFQQVLPRYVSTDCDGGNEREFLDGYFDNPGRMLDAVFLKGYQWPFDANKVRGFGSSLIDILVYNETVIRGRRVYLDYTRNPSSASTNGELDFSLSGEECRHYLEKSGALYGIPVERLEHMNPPAVALFKDHGIDLRRDYLEIAVCAQHNNGGLYGDIWWESNRKHFFPVGEVNGSHGVYRPGGSALNAGQVGSTRAAQYISRRYREQPPPLDEFLSACMAQVEKKLAMGERFAANIGQESTVAALRSSIHERMDRCGGILRCLEDIRSAITDTAHMLGNLESSTRLWALAELPDAYRNYDLLLAGYAYLSAIAFYIESGGKSRGSYLVWDSDGVLPSDNLPDQFRFTAGKDTLSDRIQVITLKNGVCECEWETVRPIPHEDIWFERVWNDFMNDRIIE
ncbi:FAD-binding protein [bacterium]|nr:FAD-binding protein [bacterium]